MTRFVPLLAALFFMAGCTAATPARAQQRTRPADYKDRADRIIAAALEDNTAYDRLGYLCDHIGNRLSGSSHLDDAIRWAQDEMRKDGFENVRGEKVMVPHWVRGEESAELIEPTRLPLVMLGLGNSVGTPPGGITADIVVVRSFEEMETLGEAGIHGRIVLYNVPYTNYGATGTYRWAGASRAAKLGAVAVLVRSVGPISLRTPHTGSLRYADDAPKIPAAAVTIEDSESLARMAARGERVRVALKMGAKFLPDAPSANVVAELRGTEKPDEVVVVGGHLDSWDVGQGAMDDGGGCLAAWSAVRLLKQLGLRPRRTIRIVLWVNEENGGRGGRGYADQHAVDLSRHVLAIESDSGVTRPLGFGVGGGGDTALATAREIGSLLAPIGADKVTAGGGEADISPLMDRGVVGMGLSVDSSHYFDIHHTPADTFDKIDRTQLSRCVAALAVMAYVAADLPQRLDGK